MQREIITTADGSKTIQIKDWEEQYHSKHGAVQEAYHVFIKHGLELFKGENIRILEIGFGTGLNAFITLLESKALDLKIEYHGIEAYPVALHEIKELNYVSILKAGAMQAYFDKMHNSSWEEKSNINSNFTLLKLKKFFSDIDDEQLHDLIYFDAFGARVQPELWTVEIFQKMFTALKPGGFLVTYAAKGSVRRAMQEVGLVVERLPGPPGKREMLRAKRPS
ncbi:tRNA (5-methylaminomethyl-2-thiouridine)(34)-methyltransferase MnmD [Maribacter sp. CXY002]|uniref:tRNA (5-methylaminomethyl-2-thiouridine)(34)-methyltransferase MnmD n=1 Tax=Maribacter luteocoastalis TaxID=3407671 RepID=UPI003B6764E2